MGRLEKALGVCSCTRSAALEFCPTNLPDHLIYKSYYLPFSSITSLLASYALSFSVERVNDKMEPSEDLIPRLRAQIASLESVLADLKTELTKVENYYKKTAPASVDTDGHTQTQANSFSPPCLVKYNEKTFESFVDQLDLSQEEKCGRSWELTAGEYKRYGRQLIMPEIGLGGGPSSLNYNVRLFLTQTGNRTAAT